MYTVLLRKRRRKREEEVSGKKKVDKELEEREEGYIREKFEYDNVILMSLMKAEFVC